MKEMAVGAAKEAVGSAWLALVFVPSLSWAAFLWIGSKAKQRKWVTAAWLYFALYTLLFAAFIFAAIKFPWWAAFIFFLLYFAVWIVSIIHAFRCRKEYLLRREALAGQREEEARAYRDKIQSDYQPPPPVAAALAQDIYRSTGLDPKGIRGYLEQLKAEHPGAHAPLGDCVKQLDAIQSRRAKLGQLIALNNAAYLTDATGALREAEQLILQNLMWVVNRGIVLESGDGGEREFGALLQKVLAANNEVLEKCRVLLTGASDLISGKGNTASVAAIEAWTVAIRQQVRTSALNGTEE